MGLPLLPLSILQIHLSPALDDFVGAHYKWPVLLCRCAKEGVSWSPSCEDLCLSWVRSRQEKAEEHKLEKW